MKRSRSDSRVKLDHYDNLLSKTILAHQHPVTGLLPAFLYKDGTPGWARNDAWVRDNVYCVWSIWGMAVAYRRRAESSDDRQKAYQLEQSVVKLMRSLLFCMMQQIEKVEDFKTTLDRGAALHAKYNMSTCSTIVGDYAWGHLQIDATSLFLLSLAQMTAAGLQLVYTLDEVAFLQNLVYYIEEAFRIPDYGIWERGDKTNHGETELNASSIGMAKAALEAMNGLDMFGSRGGPSSVIHVMYDNVAQCDTKLNSLLPRESSSKEIDAGLLTIIGFPAFAVERQELVRETHDQIISKLLGNYGCRRFLRDGYQTAKEDSSRLHYEPAELKVFENIECEWPLFFCLLLMDALIKGDYHSARKYREKLDKVVICGEDGLERVPELYLVPEEGVPWEYREPHSQPRVPGPKVQHMWSQSLYVLCGLLQNNLLAIGEIDPLNRRLVMMPKPDPLVQVVLLSEDFKLCGELTKMGIRTQTIRRVERDPTLPVKILPARYLSRIFGLLGVNKKTALSGRPRKSMGVISTSQLYSIHGNMAAFTPSFLDHEFFYLCLDNRLLVDLIRTDLAYLKSNWKLMGRPTIVLPILRIMLGEEDQWDKSPIFRLAKALASGYTSGARVRVGLMSEFISTASVQQLHFIDPTEAGKILDIPEGDLMLHHRQSMLVQRTDSFVKPDRFDPRQKGSRKYGYGSVRKSRKTPPTPPTKKRSFSGGSLPEGGEPLPVIVASAYSGRRMSLKSQERLKSGIMLGPACGTSTPRRTSFNMSSIDEILKALGAESNIYAQTDILHQLYDTCGKDYKVQMGDQECTIASLLEEVYQKAGVSNLWSLVRHTAGMLQKRVEELGSAATDLLVRQKHFSVGQPNSEIHITQPVPSKDVLRFICEVSGDDHSAVALTQEILVYLAMFIRSEPELFTEMLRLRIGLIQNVMVSELSRAMECSFEDALDRLLDLSPFDLKHLIHLIFSRKEFSVDEISSRHDSIVEGQVINMPVRQLSIIASSKRHVHGKLQKDVQILGSPVSDAPRGLQLEESEEKHGQWQRRRRLDGALNRVPLDFYSEVWHILENCEGISIGNQYLPRSPTVQEMTPGELKFALRVESVLNSLPDPEFRQIVVETLGVLALAARSKNHSSFGNTSIVVEHIINHARILFLQDQKQHGGPATECCLKHVGSCGGPAGVCVFFYDCAPSGRYGTMSYLAQAVADQLRGTHKPSDECKIS